MTVIIGIADGRAVYMGADSFIGNGDYALQYKHPKIVRRELPGGQPILFGVSGETRPMLLLGAMTLPEHKPGVDALYYVGIELVNAMRTMFGEAGFSTAQDGREHAANTTVLIGYDGRLFAIWHDYTHAETANGYMAVGSGMYVALGALAATEGIDPFPRLEKVLTAAARHNAYVRAPYVVETIGPGWKDRTTVHFSEPILSKGGAMAQNTPDLTLTLTAAA